jgi:uncharacterized membrane protein YphA (DoxX/SURF4 family)
MKKFLYYLPRVIAAFIMVQTLFFKFGFGGEEALQESRNLFSTVTEFFFGNPDLEWLMRIGTGVGELVASILLFVPKYSKYGALMTIGLMGGAIATHILALGIVYNDDGGTLFIMALITLSGGITSYFADKRLELQN